MFTFFWLAVGLVLGTVYVTYARSRSSGVKRVFGSGLIIVALIYFAFIFRAPNPAFWAAVAGRVGGWSRVGRCTRPGTSG
jgi:hypothetical protein